MRFYPKHLVPRSVIAIAACVVLALGCYAFFPGNIVYSEETISEAAARPASDTQVELTPGQLETVKIAPAELRDFRREIEAVGSVAYHEKDDAQPLKPATSRFIVANIHESDGPFVHVGQTVKASVPAYPGHVYEGRVSVLGVTAYDSGGNPAVDPGTHRIAARCEIADPGNELYPGMLATLVIQAEKPVQSVAVPEKGVVREGDGIMTVWVTADRHHFSRKTVTVGLQQGGYDQILDGIDAGELVVTENAVFLSNMNNADSQ